MLTVATDSRVRTLSAALAATDWPDREQRPLPRGVHPQAAALRRHVSPLRDHPAVSYVQSALNIDLDPLPLFIRALNDEPELAAHLREFAAAAALDAYWAANDAPWAEAVAAVQQHVSGVDFTAILLEACDTAPAELIVLPNLAYPTALSLGISAGDSSYSLMPPRRAVGESQPWPFSDDRDHVLKLAINDFCLSALDSFFAAHPGLLPETSAASERLPEHFRAVHPTWPRQIAKLFTYGILAVFLNRIEPGEGDALILYDRRTKGLPLLPSVVNSVTDYLEAKANGQATLADYLPRLAGEVTGWLA